MENPGKTQMFKHYVPLFLEFFALSQLPAQSVLKFPILVLATWGPLKNNKICLKIYSKFLEKSWTLQRLKNGNPNVGYVFAANLQY